jgi:hypothetical protein
MYSTIYKNGSISTKGIAQFQFRLGVAQFRMQEWLPLVHTNGSIQKTKMAQFRLFKWPNSYNYRMSQFSTTEMAPFRLQYGESEQSLSDTVLGFPYISFVSLQRISCVKNGTYM